MQAGEERREEKEKKQTLLPSGGEPDSSTR